MIRFMIWKEIHRSGWQMGWRRVGRMAETMVSSRWLLAWGEGSREATVWA